MYVDTERHTYIHISHRAPRTTPCEPANQEAAPTPVSKNCMLLTLGSL